MKKEEKRGIIKSIVAEERRVLMNKIFALMTVSEAVTEAVSSPALSPDDVSVIVGISLCVLLGFVLSFFILARIKRK